MNLRKLLNWKKRKEEDKELKSTFDEYTISGHRFRVVKDFGQSMFNRGTAFQYALKDADYGMTKADLLQLVKTGKEYIDQGRTSDVATLLSIIETNITNYTPIRVLWQICNPLILMDGESENNLDEEYSSKKLELVKSNKEIESFFLAISINLCKVTGHLSKDIHVSDYMTGGNIRKAEETLSNLNGRGIYEGL